MLRRLSRQSGSVGDFNVFLHELRSRELEQLPGGARTVLHGGCHGTWYFDWFAERYPTKAERHIGVEAFAERPSELGEGVEWLQRSLGDLEPVDDGEVDLVFAGQVIEHLWPEEVTGFLLESHRVLRPGGTLAVDSPNRRVTTAIGWEHPEHTVEFRPDEALEIFALAGFEQAGSAGFGSASTVIATASSLSKPSRARGLLSAGPPSPPNGRRIPSCGGSRRRAARRSRIPHSWLVASRRSTGSTGALVSAASSTRSAS